jgi:hypothetical protein
MVIAAGTARGPGVGLAVSTSVEVLSVELVEAAAREAQFCGRRRGIDVAAAEAGQKVADEGRSTPTE